MPPRRRPPPPPPRVEVEVEPSSSSEPPSHVDPAKELGPDTAASIIQPLPGILAKLPAPVRTVYASIFAAGSKGKLMPDVRRETRMSVYHARKHTNALKEMGLVKEICDVRNRSKKILVASDFEPDSEVAGGTWYQDGGLDTEAVDAARRRCLAQVKKHGSATARMIHEGIHSAEPRAGYDEAKVRGILSAMVLDKELDEVVRSGMTWYRVAERQQGGVMEAIPCGVCPRIDECSPEAIVSPNTCVYYQEWLRMDF